MFGATILPKSAGQCKLLLALQGDKEIVICTGPTGSGKTRLACSVAVDYIARRKQVILTRPVVACEESIGWLPGDLQSKMAPWTKPIEVILQEHCTLHQMDRSVTVEPLGFMRGRTYQDCCVIADELQNSTPEQFKCLLTRLGPNTKLICTGDLAQSDLDKRNGLEDFLERIDGIELKHVVHVDLENDDIVRHPAVAEIIKVYEI